MAPLRGRDADGRMVREPRRDPTKVGGDPHPGAASVTKCQRVVLWWGSRRRSRRGLHHRMAIFVAFPSHPNGRSPIACPSPPVRRHGRTPGGLPATLVKTPNSGLAAPGPFAPDSLFFSCIEILRITRDVWSPSRDFRSSRRASARNPLFVLQIVFVVVFVGRLTSAVSPLSEAKYLPGRRQKCPANADSMSGKCR